MISRRSLLVGSAAALALSRLARTAKADPAAKPNSAVVLVYFMGGYNAIFPTAKSFVGTNEFGVTASNVTNAGNGMIVDSSLFGQLTPARWQKMAQVGVAHGISNHDSAQNALWTTSKKRSRPLMLADALGGEAAIRCAALGRKPPGFHGQVGDASMQVISSLGTVLAAYGKSVDPTAPGRASAARGLTAAGAMSQGRMANNPTSGADMKAGYPAGSDLLTKATPGLDSFDMNTIAPAYGLPATIDQVNDIRSQLLGAELMIRTGTRVITVAEGASPTWDSHGDIDGSLVRSQMDTRFVAASLKTFLDRMADPAINGGVSVTTVLFGDFSRSLPGSDHAASLTATAFGNKVKPGSTGDVLGNVHLAPGTPGIDGFWSYVSALAGLDNVGDWGTNPHASITV